MNLLSVTLLFSGDPLAGLVVLGSGALIAWALVAACVGSLLALLRERGGGSAVSAETGGTPGRYRPGIAGSEPVGAQRRAA